MTCISLVVDADVARLAAALGLPSLLATSPTTTARRVEAKEPAWVLRPTASGRLVAEAMAFHPHQVRRQYLAGNPRTNPLIGNNHGLIVVRGYSAWISAKALVHSGAIPEHEAHCAFNRTLLRPGGEAERGGRQLLVNFTPATPLFVPVLFDRLPEAVLGQGGKEFVMITDQPPPPFDQLGLSHGPLGLSLAAAFEWLYAAELDPLTGDCEALLDQPEGAACSFALYKSA